MWPVDLDSKDNKILAKTFIVQNLILLSQKMMMNKITHPTRKQATKRSLYNLRERYKYQSRIWKVSQTDRLNSKIKTSNNEQTL